MCCPALSSGSPPCQGPSAPSLPALPRAPVTSPPRTWWEWGRGQDWGPSSAHLSPKRIQGRLQGAPLSTEGKAEATKPEAALAGAAPAPSHPLLPGHSTPRQPRPGPGREAASRTHQLCTEGAAETLRVGAQPRVMKRRPQADATGTHSHDLVLKHKGCRPAPMGSDGPSRKAQAQPLVYGCSLAQHPPSCLHPTERWREGRGASGGDLWVCPLLLPRLSPGWAAPGLTWLCAIQHSPILSDTLWIWQFLPWTKLFLSISVSVSCCQAPCPHQHMFLHRGVEARPPAPTLLPADGSTAAGAPGTRPACPARRAAAQPGNPAQRQPSDFSGKARNPGFKVKSPHFKTLAAKSPKTK